MKAGRDLQGRKNGLSAHCMFYKLGKYTILFIVTNGNTLLSIQEVHLEPLFTVRSCKCKHFLLIPR